MTAWLYNRVLEPSGIEAVITNDGAIVFNKDLIERIDGVTPDEAAEDVLNYAEKLKAEEGIRYSERDTSLLSKREILAGAFDSVAKSDSEKGMLQDYKRLIRTLNRMEARAAELRNMNAQERARGAEADRELIKTRVQEIRDIENRINEADRKLLRMQNAAPLRELFKRESARISEKAREDTRNKLTEWRQKREGNAERTRLTNSISKTTMAMQKWIAEPNTKTGAYVPDMLVSPLGKLLEGIDLQSRRSLNGGEKTSADKKFIDGPQNFLFLYNDSLPR